MTFVRIPQDRVGVLIGKDGEVKREIERMGNVSLRVESDGGVEIIGDAANAYRVAEVVKAIGRGFSPERALRLLKDDMLMLCVIEIPSDSHDDLVRIRGRIIGRNGRTRSIIEELTQTDVSVYGKTVSIIGYPDRIMVAREAVEMLINGSPHGTVYSFLERKRRELRER